MVSDDDDTAYVDIPMGEIIVSFKNDFDDVRTSEQIP